MNRIIIMSLPLLLLAAAPAHALPERFSLEGRGASKATGELQLEGKAGAKRRAMVLSVQDEGKTIALRGTLKRKGQRLEASLRDSNGIVPRLAGQHRRARWKVSIRAHGLTVDVTLSQGRKTLTLSGETDLGPRHAGNEALIRRFYEAFARHDGETMAASYAPDAHFSDPVFPSLSGTRAGNMWRMLCGSKPEVTFSGVRAGARYGTAQWIAKYEVFGNRVINVIQASFELRDGKIVDHVDSFSFKTWASQAYGKTLTFLAERPLLGVTRLVTANRLSSFEKDQAKAKQPKRTRRRRKK